MRWQFPFLFQSQGQWNVRDTKGGTSSVLDKLGPRHLGPGQLEQLGPDYRTPGLIGICFHSTRGNSVCLSVHLFVCLSVITSTFPIWGLQIIAEPCQTQHITHQWKEDEVRDDNDNYKDTHKDKDKHRRKLLTRR